MPSSGTSLSLSGGGCHDLNSFLPCFVVFLVGWLTRGPAWSFLFLFREGQ